jgi:two-component system OmpR family response regulator
MKILVIEDDLKISSLISKSLKESNYIVDVAYDGEEGLHLFQSAKVDLVILDLMLPKLDGLSLLEKIRSEGVSIPVLILSANDSIEDRVKGLLLGADDYLVKPFSINELMARVQVLLRRSLSNNVITKLHFKDLKMDLATRRVIRGEEKIELHAKEFMLLELFLQNTNKVITKTQILEKVWEYNFDPQTNVVDVLVCRLRSKIDNDEDHKIIHTIRGVGYVLKNQESSFP